MSDLPAFRLLEFIPFRILRLAAKVGEPFSDAFQGKFGFDLPEWRVLANVAQAQSSTARDIAQITGMHKTRVSRAVSDLAKLGLIERVDGVKDRREVELRVTERGETVYRQAVEMALQSEREIMSGLSMPERRRLEGLVTKLELSLGLPHASRAPLPRDDDDAEDDR